MNIFGFEIPDSAEVIENMNGSYTRDSHGNTLIVCHGSVVINKNGKRIVLKGKRIGKRNGEWYVDGKKADTSEVNVTPSDDVKIEIIGSVENLSTMCGDVTINGNCKYVKTASGDVKCKTATNIHTMSGDVYCENVEGNISTMSGDIIRR